MKNLLLIILLFILIPWQVQCRIKSAMKPRHEIGIVAIISSELVGNYGIPKSQIASSLFATQFLSENAAGKKYFTNEYGIEKYSPIFHYAFYVTPKLAFRARYLYSQIAYTSQYISLANPLSAIDINYLAYLVKSKEASLGFSFNFFKYQDFSFFMGSDLTYTKSVYNIQWINLHKPTENNPNLLIVNDATDHFHAINPKLFLGTRISFHKHINATFEFSKRLNDVSNPKNYFINIGMNYTTAKNKSKRCHCKSMY